jgi:hypothetical protein
MARESHEYGRLSDELRRQVETRYRGYMAEPQALDFDNPAGMLDEEDEATLAAIDEGIAQIEAEQGIPLEDLRKEISKRCSR